MCGHGWARRCRSQPQVNYQPRCSTVDSKAPYQLCRPIWTRWLTDAVLSGALTLPGFAKNQRQYLRVKWIAPKWDWVDPLKDRQAEKIAQEMGWKAPSDIIEAEGQEVDETYRRIAEDQQRAKQLGIVLGDPGEPPRDTAEPLKPEDENPQQPEP